MGMPTCQRRHGVQQLSARAVADHPITAVFFISTRKDIFFRMALFAGCMLLSQMEALGSASTKRKE
jgi:hypothetical protein